VILSGSGSWEVVPTHDAESGGVLIGPCALPYEIELAAELLRGRRIPAERPFLVAPATPSVFRLAHRRGWAEMIVAAGGSVLDVGLTRRLGTMGLLKLATGDRGTVWCTRPPEGKSRTQERPLVVGSVHSIVDQLGPLF
jgi:homoaconitase/3-isopropylmalate dehydratase large subunit